MLSGKILLRSVDRYLAHYPVIFAAWKLLGKGRLEISLVKGKRDGGRVLRAGALSYEGLEIGIEELYSTYR